MLAFLIGVSIAVFIVGSYEIYKHLKKKKELKKGDKDIGH